MPADKSDLPRLIEYFIITSASTSKQKQPTPKITYRFPLTDHLDNPLPNDAELVLFTMPDGVTVLNGDREYRLPSIHYFVVTNEKGRRGYGVTITFFEENSLLEEGDRHTHNKHADAEESSTSSVTNDSDFESAAESSDLDSESDSPTESKLNSLLQSFDIDDSSSISSSTSTAPIPLKLAVKLYYPKSITLLLSSPYLPQVRSYLLQIYRLSTTPSLILPLERYIQNIVVEVPPPYPKGLVEVQVSLYGGSPSSNGNPSVLRFWELGGGEPLCWISLDFTPLFSTLPLPTLLFIFHSLSVEKQILFLSRKSKTLVVEASEILTSLLWPFTWQHVYIAYLPEFLQGVLAAPMPWVVGMMIPSAVESGKTAVWGSDDDESEDFVLLNYDISPDAIVVNLDRGEAYVWSDEMDRLIELRETILTEEKVLAFSGIESPQTRARRPPRPPRPPPSNNIAGLPNLPPRAGGKLMKKLKDKVGHIYQRAHGLDEKTSPITSPVTHRVDPWDARLSTLDDAFSLALLPSDADCDNYEGSDEDDDLNQSDWDAVQEAFLRFFVSLLKDYRRFLIFPAPGNALGAGFKTNSFLSSLKVHFSLAPAHGGGVHSNSDAGMFLKALCSTQMFDAFITKRLFSPGEPDVTFFDEKIDQKMNRYRMKIKKVETPFLHSAKIRRKLKTVVAPEPTGKGLNDDEEDYDDDNDDTDATKIMKQQKKKNPTFTYAIFPSKFNESLFGTPRPLPTVMEAEGLKALNTARLRNKRTSIAGLFGADEKGSKGVKGTNGSDGGGHDFFDRAKNSLRGLGSKSHSDRDMSDKVFTASAEAATCTVFFMAYTAVVGKELKKLEEDRAKKSSVKTHHHHHQPPAGDNSSNTSASAPTSGRLMRHDEETYEEAMATAKAQLDLAFEVLNMMRDRKITPESYSYECLIDACGRCGDTDRACQLLAMMHKDGVVADSVVYSCLVKAFSVSNQGRLKSDLKKKSHISEENLPAFTNGYTGGFDWNELRKGENSSRGGNGGGVSERPSVSSNNSIASSFKSSKSKKRGGAGNVSPTPKWWHASTSKPALEGFSGGVGIGGVRRVSSPKNAMKTFFSSLRGAERRNSTPTEQEYVLNESCMRQVILGDNLLDVLYPNVKINTNREICGNLGCQHRFNDADICSGWNCGAAHDYCIVCNKCSLKQVVRFTVISSAVDWEGTAGTGGKLFCEFLSPWVLRKELMSILSDSENEGIEFLLRPDFPKLSIAKGLIYWNLILSFKRLGLPITFLFLGSFGNGLIAPTPDSSVG